MSVRTRSLGLFVLIAVRISAKTVAVPYLETTAGKAVFDNLPPRDTPLIQPQSVWVHPNGDVFIADGNFLVRRVRGNVTNIVAGGGNRVDDAVAILGRTASLDYPSSIVGVAGGEVYITDVRRHRVRRISADGNTITTVVGRGTQGYSGDDGQGAQAELNSPLALALSAAGDLYIGDSGNYVIRKFNPRTGVITTVAGTGEPGSGPDDVPATRAAIGAVGAIAVDASGTIYFSDISNYTIRKVSPAGVISTIAGTGEEDYSGDGGRAVEAGISEVFGLALDAAGNLYLADTANDRVRRITPQGTISTYAGGATTRAPGVDGPAAQAYVDGPAGIAFDARGNLHIAETNSNLIRRVDAASVQISTVAGTSNPYDGPQGAVAPLVRPTAVASDRAGNLFIADNGHFRVRRIDRASGAISTVAGNGREATALAEGAATAVALGASFSISIDPQGRLLIADSALKAVRRVDLAAGRIATLVNLTDRKGVPAAAIGDATGNIVFISDRGNHQILRLTGTRVEVLAGTGERGNDGDGGRATQAELDSPEGLLLDAAGRLLFADSGSSVVRRINLSTGVIERFAGSGGLGYDGDLDDAVDAALANPVALAADGAGNVYIADYGAHVVRVVAANGKIDTLGGSGDSGYSGDDGPAVLGKFDTPAGLAVIGADLYVGDSLNYRIRRVYARQVQNALIGDPARLGFRAEQDGDYADEQLVSFRSLAVAARTTFKITAATDSGGAWLVVAELEQGQTPETVLVSVDHSDLPAGKYTGTIIATSPGLRDLRIPVELEVTPPDNVNRLDADPNPMQFDVLRGEKKTDELTISSRALGAETFSIRLLNTAPWLKLSATSGAVPATITVEVNSAGLSPDTYLALLDVKAGSGTVTELAISMTVSDPAPALELDIESMVFRGVEGSTFIPEQVLRIYNPGAADLNWTISAPAAATWLRISTLGGTTKPDGAPGSVPGAVRVAVNPAGLKPGVYTAAVAVRGNSPDSPQSLNVRLRITEATTPPQPVFSAAALVFSGSPGAANARSLPAQTIELTSTGGAALSFTSTVRTVDGGRWLSLSPGSGTIEYSSQRQRLRFEASTSGLPEGVYNGSVTFSFSNGSVQEVKVLLIFRAGAVAVAPRAAKGVRAAGCNATRLLLVAPALPNNFSLSAGWPTPLRAQALDDCGVPQAGSTVNVAFTNGDPPLVLTNLKDGNYSGTWTPNAGANVTVTMRSVHPSLPAASDLKLSGKLLKDAVLPPILFAGGVVNAASQRKSSFIAPGGLLSLRGANFPSTTADLTVLIGGVEARALSASAGELKVLAPVEIEGRSQASVIVSAGGYLTSAENVSVGSADPGLYAVEGLKVAAGEVLTVRATGLGSTGGDGKVKATVTARLGEQAAVVESATLANDSDGVYEVRITAPPGLTGTRQLTIAAGGGVSNSIPVSVD